MRCQMMAHAINTSPLIQTKTMYAPCLQGELKQKTLMLHKNSQAGQMNMCPSRQWGASIPPIFSMGGFSSGPLVDLLQLDLPKHPNHVWKAHRLGMIHLSAAVKLWSCRHALGLQSTGAPPAAGLHLFPVVPVPIPVNVESLPAVLLQQWKPVPARAES